VDAGDRRGLHAHRDWAHAQESPGHSTETPGRRIHVHISLLERRRSRPLSPMDNDARRHGARCV